MLTPALTPVPHGKAETLLSPNGRWTAILDREVGSLELEDGQGVEQTMFPAGSAVAEAKWSPDNRMLAVVLGKQPENGQSGVGNSPPEVRLVEFADGEFHTLGSAYKPEEPLAAPSQIVLGAWSPDGKRLLFWTGLLSASITADGLPLWVLDVGEMQATRQAETALLNPDYQS